MCVKHYQQWKKYGDALHNEKRQYMPYGNRDRRYYKTTNGNWLHKVVAEENLGRKLNRGEIVHHINLDKLDNNPSNIYVCKNNGSHLSLHRQLEQIAGELVRDGIIFFENGKYKRNI